MAVRYDILQIDNDIVIENNDLVLTESDDQHIQDTINANAGWWKENHTDGVGLFQYIRGQNVQQKISKAIKIGLQTDGYNSAPTVEYGSNGQLIINPNVSI